jgi:HD-GYP domain-containing protein (c-di-GMP phosphodiesterase class II)
MAIAALDKTVLAGGCPAADEALIYGDAKRPARSGGELLAHALGGPVRALTLLPRAMRATVLAVAGAGGAAGIATSAGTPAAIAGAALALAFSGALLGLSLAADSRGRLERDMEDRERELLNTLSELEVAEAETVRRLTMAVELRDKDTGAHIERMGRLSALLAEQIGMEPGFCKRLGHAAPLHDVGKVAIPDAVLLKPGPLDPEERAIIETHAEEGHRLLYRSSSTILELAASVALTHHERWDGAGYPRGIAREEIPIEGRIVAITDVFDALTTDRIYRKAYPIDQAIALMREQRGRHFDPVLLDAFMEVIGVSEMQVRAHIRSNPRALVAGLLEVFTKALERGDHDMAEGAISQAIEDGISPATLHAALLAPAARRIGELWEAGDIEAAAERTATAIVRRVLATLYRYMMGSAEPTRERVLVAAVEGDRQALELQMVHDQLAAAGFQATLVSELSPERVADTLRTLAPQVLVLGGTGPLAARCVQRVLGELTRVEPGLPVLVTGLAAREAPGATSGHERVCVCAPDRIDRSVELVEGLLGGGP